MMAMRFITIFTILFLSIGGINIEKPPSLPVHIITGAVANSTSHNNLMFATYYIAPRTISPKGDDANAGTILAPWFTLDKVWNSVSAGDLVYCRGGSYNYVVSQYLDALNGTAGNLIKIWNYPGETPVFTDSVTYDIGTQDLIYLEGDYFHFKGLEIANFEQRSGENAWSAFRCGFTNNSIFEMLNYHDNASAFKIQGNSTGNLVKNCDFWRNQNPFAPDAYGGADGIDFGIGGSNAANTNTIIGCRAWWNSDDGFDTYLNEGYVLIDSCWSWYNGFIPGTFTNGGDGSGFKLGATAGSYFSTLKRTLQNSLAYENRNYGIVENDLRALSNVFNNTAVGDDGIFGIYYGAWNASAIGTLVNNISYDQTDDIAAHVVQTTNSWQGFTVTGADFLSTDVSQLDDARQADGTLPTINFYHLVSSSDLRNAGTNESLPGWRNPPDIGAFQSGTATFVRRKFGKRTRLQ